MLFSNIVTHTHTIDLFIALALAVVVINWVRTYEFKSFIHFTSIYHLGVPNTEHASHGMGIYLSFFFALFFGRANH